jgi:general stress protein 26
MEKARFDKAMEIMQERFGHDSLISLATVSGRIPSVRTVNSYYQNGAFYVITYALSHKMQEIACNDTVGICGEWFTAHGKAENLGPLRAAENAAILNTLRSVFAAWYTNGHTDESDPNTILLCIRLTDGVLMSHGTRYDLDFSDLQAN